MKLNLKHKQQNTKRATEHETTVAADTVAAAKAEQSCCREKSQSIV